MSNENEKNDPKAEVVKPDRNVDTLSELEPENGNTITEHEISNAFYTGENLRSAIEQSQAAQRALDRLSSALPSISQLEESYQIIKDLSQQNKELEIKVKQLENLVYSLQKTEEKNINTGVSQPEKLKGTEVRRTSDTKPQRTKSSFDPSNRDIFRRKLSADIPVESVGTDALRSLEIGERNDQLTATSLASSRLTSKRSGFRLLLCNDESCELQLVREGFITVSHLTKTLVKFKWHTKPNLVLIVKRPNDINTTKAMIQVAKRLRDENILVMVEQSALSELGEEKTENMIGRMPSEFHLDPVDLIICLGGDGTLIWASSVFPQGIPPILSFSMGSLGFMTPFPVSRLQDTITAVITDELHATIRSRIEVEVTKYLEGSEKPINMTFSVLNEITVDRGPSSSIVNLRLYIGNRDEPITFVQGDGIIIATPTGSTAYSLASGGSMIHPGIPAMCITPICPHSLSFRPIVVADSTYIKLEVPETARNSAWVSFDGKNPLELKRGDFLQCRISKYPVMSFCAVGESADWLAAIKDGFLWNVRTLQRSLSSSQNERSGKL